jgi:hypothetical protein
MLKQHAQRTSGGLNNHIRPNGEVFRKRIDPDKIEDA